jgi:hypothetical protein
MTDEALTDDELVELERLTSAATPGPWTANIEEEAPIGGCSMIGLDGLPDDFPPDMYVYHDQEIAPTADIKFIAAARNYMPRLIAELRRLRGHSGTLAQAKILTPAADFLSNRRRMVREGEPPCSCAADGCFRALRNRRMRRVGTLARRFDLDDGPPIATGLAMRCDPSSPGMSRCHSTSPVQACWRAGRGRPQPRACRVRATPCQPVLGVRSRTRSTKRFLPEA